jgi:prepilin-type N-terminal cleavage/methylation domain-containing protein
MAHSSTMKLGEQGFTLIEMTVAMMIIFILAAMAIYTYIPLIGRLRLSADVRKVDQALQQAKMYAVSRGVAAGVVYFRRDGAATGTTPDEMYIFLDTATVGTDIKERYTDDDKPCHGCVMNKIYNCQLDPLCNPNCATDTLCNTTDTHALVRKEFIPVRCDSKDTFPDCTNRPLPSDYMKKHDVIVDGPIPLENGDYFTRILGSTNPAATSIFSTYKYEFILFDPFGGVIYPDPATAATVDSRRVYLQNHPVRASSGASVDRAAVQMNFVGGLSQVVRLGPAAQDAWLAGP